MPTLYAIKSYCIGHIVYLDVAYTNKDIADHEATSLSEKLKRQHWVEEIQLPKLDDYVYYVRSTCCGNNLFGNFADAQYSVSNIYASIDDAKTDEIWVDAANRIAQYDNAYYHISDTMMASKMKNGEPFHFGIDGFNVKINNIKVDRSDKKE